MIGFRRHLAGITSAVAITAVLSLVLASTVVASSAVVVHSVSAGGPDACLTQGFAHPGCDGNFTLAARKYANGSMSGEYTDRLSRGDGFHAVIDCLSVDGADAWVSGVITSGSVGGFDLTGLPIATRVRDNGTSTNDPPDQISYSFIDDFSSHGVFQPCTDHPSYDLLDAPQGQVVVK
jgi:hypothetical protein